MIAVRTSPARSGAAVRRRTPVSGSVFTLIPLTLVVPLAFVTIGAGTCEWLLKHTRTIAVTVDPQLVGGVTRPRGLAFPATNGAQQWPPTVTNCFKAPARSLAASTCGSSTCVNGPVMAVQRGGHTCRSQGPTRSLLSKHRAALPAHRQGRNPLIAEGSRECPSTRGFHRLGMRPNDAALVDASSSIPL